MTLSPCIERLRKRAAAVRTRAAIRSWKYRQRNLAAGVWYQVRRSLANAREAWEIPLEAAEQLIADGGKPEEWGVKLEPPKVVLFLDREQIDRIAARRRIPVRLGPDFLLAPAVALVSFSSK